MSIFIIKIIACFTMILDHIKYAIPAINCFFTVYLGRIAFPLFAFLAAQGYVHTSNLKNYYKRLFIFALISQIPFMLFRTLVGEWKMLNIMFTLMLGLFSINVFDKLEKKYYFSIPLVLLIIYLGKILNVDYGWYGVATVFVLYLFKNNKFLRIIGFAVLCFIYYYPRLTKYFSTQYLISYICSVFPMIILLGYNGKLGRKTKYIYYIFYPVHMLVLYIISLI